MGPTILLHLGLKAFAWIAALLILAIVFAIIDH